VGSEKAMEWLTQRIEGAQTIVDSGVGDWKQGAIEWQAGAMAARDCIASLTAALAERDREIERLKRIEAAAKKVVYASPLDESYDTCVDDLQRALEEKEPQSHE
jgi:hypothetical protein